MKAVIVGHTGQDGTLLSILLEKKGYDVLGFSSTALHCSAPEGFPFKPDISDPESIISMVAAFRPDELYYLAAYHVSSEQDEKLPVRSQFLLSQKIHVTGLLNCLCAVRGHAPLCKIFYASSSLIFNGTDGHTQDEQTPISPVGFYGMTKAQGMWLCREFQNKYGIFASAGILYNHESHLRGSHFLSKKIIDAAIQISRGSKNKLILGSLQAKVDWSYAPDVVDAMHRILGLEEADTFIISRGTPHSVLEFVQVAFSYFNLDWEKHVEENSGILIRNSKMRIGNCLKLEKKTGWKPSLNFQAMVNQLIEDTIRHEQKQAAAHDRH